LNDSIGFIGLGAMGSPMVARLAAAGRELVVWSRTKSHADPLLSDRVHWAGSAREVGGRARVVLSCLLNDAVIEEVYFRGGLLDALDDGSLLVEHGTFSPALSRRVFASARNVGLQFVDAPVSGGASGAGAGRLVCMAGGVEEAVERLRPIASAYCASVTHVGPSGAGVQLKLANQLLVAGNTVLVAEAAALMRSAQIDPALALSVLSGGYGGSAMLTRNLVPMLTNDWPDEGASVAHLAEVLDLVGESMAILHIPTILEPTVRTVLRQAIEAGLSDLDMASIYRLYNANEGQLDHP
jgi:3-hydroxyisobutyrate dehydrogenase-like beta-hydroxyacid dehydrogenase